MSAKESQSRMRHVHLQSQQRRLRHLRSISARNLKPKFPAGHSSHKDSLLDTHFTLYCGEHHGSEEFYRSETIKHSLNPTWRSFDPSSVTNLDTASTNFTIRCWCECCEEKTLLIEWNVDLTGLVFLGEQLIMKQDGKAQSPNSIIFGLVDGYYGAPDNAQEYHGSVSEPGKLNSLKVSSDCLVPVYSVSSLSRLHTLQTAIQQTNQQVDTSRKSIQTELIDKGETHSKQAEQESLRLKLKLLREELDKQKVMLKEETEVETKLKNKVKRKVTEMKKLEQTLAHAKSSLKQKQQTHIEKRELLVKINAQLMYRRRQLISELMYIYPIHKLKDGYAICGARLPNSEEFLGVDEECISFALGNVSHVVMIITNFLNVPLRYPITMFGSRSIIRDLVMDKLADRDREFPLFNKGREKYQFHYAVYLLNKNIAQLRHHCGMQTADLRQTLPNLKHLLDSFSGDSVFNRAGIVPSSSTHLTQTKKTALTRTVSHQISRNIPSMMPQVKESRSSSIDTGLPVIAKSSTVHKFIGLKKKKASNNQSKILNNSALRTEELEDSLIITVDEANGNIITIDPTQNTGTDEQKNIEMQGIDQWLLPSTPEFPPDGSLSSGRNTLDVHGASGTTVWTQGDTQEQNIGEDLESHDYLT